MAAACLCFVCHGAISAALGPALPELAAHSGSSLAAIGSVVTALYLGSILALLASGPAIDRLGQYPIFMAGAALLGLGTIGLTIGAALPALLLAAFLGGLGHGAMDLSCNLLIAEVFPQRRAAAVSLLNVFFGIGAVAGPLTASITLKVWNTAFPALWLGGGLMLLQLLIIPRMAVAPGATLPGAHAANEIRGLRALLWSPILWTLGALTLTYVGLESGMSSWTTTYLARTTASGASAGALASAGFWLAMAGGRVAAAMAGARFSPKAMLFVTLAGALGGSALLFASTGNGPLTVTAVLLTGFFYGPVFAIIFAVTNATFRGLAGTAGSLVIAMGSIGAALLPWLQGLLLVNAGPSASVLLIAVGAIVMLVLFGSYTVVIRRAPGLEATAQTSPSALD
jgi:FHS family glucose/mannose:H+ symporter-like MFS transporter